MTRILNNSRLLGWKAERLRRKIMMFKTNLIIALIILCSVFSFSAIAQTDDAKPLDAKALTALVEELKGVVARTESDEKKSASVAEKWDKRKDLAGKTREDVIELLYEDVKSVITNKGKQYEIYSIFAFYKTIPDDKPAGDQKTFELKDASKYFDIKITAESCKDGYCGGKPTFSFYKKGSNSAYQVINLEDTQIQLDENGNAQANISMLYDNQSAVNIDDFNFDGMEDIAICDGANGSYGGPSYQVYLSSKSAGKFVYDEKFSELGSHLGMFTVDKKKKVLRIFDKSGCCWHVTEEYSVVNNRPVKVFEEAEDATFENGTDGKKVKITTKNLVKGKWQTKVRFVKREEQ
jgi:hypothetical protein